MEVDGEDPEVVELRVGEWGGDLQKVFTLEAMELRLDATIGSHGRFLRSRCAGRGGQR